MKTPFLVRANGRRSDCWGSPPRAGLVTVNWWSMHAAWSHASPIRPVACIVTVYCLSISETATFREVWSKSLLMHAAKMYMWKYWREIPTHYWVWRTKKINIFCNANCLFSPRALVSWIPARAKYLFKNGEECDICQWAVTIQFGSLFGALRHGKWRNIRMKWWFQAKIIYSVLPM